MIPAAHENHRSQSLAFTPELWSGYYAQHRKGGTLMIRKADVRAVGLCCMGLFLTPVLRADPVIANLTCQTSDGTSLTLPVYYFELSGGSAGTADLALDLPTFPQLLTGQWLNVDADAGHSYATCILDDGVTPITLTNVRPYLALATGYGGPGSAVPRLYAGANLAYTSMTLGSVTVPSARAGLDDHAGSRLGQAGIGVAALQARGAANLQ